LYQQGSWFDITGDGLAVHRHGHFRHDFLPKLGTNAPLLAFVTPDGGSYLQMHADFEPESAFEPD
jgi:hypothetical protein